MSTKVKDRGLSDKQRLAIIELVGGAQKQEAAAAWEDAPLGAPIGRLGRLPVFQATGFAGGT